MGRLLQKSEVNFPKRPGEGKPRTQWVLRRPLWEVVDVGIWARAPPPTSELQGPAKQAGMGAHRITSAH